MNRPLVVTVVATAVTLLAARPAHADVGDALRHPLKRMAPVTFTVTAYTAGPESTGKRPGDPWYGITARGTVARRGICAADPSIPFGTRLWIEGYGIATVEDRGGAIQGARLDVFTPVLEDALCWGVKRCKVVMLD